MRVRGDEAAPARHERPLAAGFGVVDFRQELDLQPVDLVAEQRQDGEQERVRDQHGRQHAEGAADSELGHEVEADEGEAADRDGHGQPGEEHRSPGRGARFRRGVAR